jgi:hypothetical protein
MELDIDLDHVDHVEFGVVREQDGATQAVQVPAEPAVQDALVEMVKASRDSQPANREARLYSPSEKYAATDYVYLPIADPLAARLVALKSAADVRVDATALQQPAAISAYFATIRDADRRELTAAKRAAQFKGVLAARLVRVFDNSVRLIEDRVFKLDADFDVLMDSRSVYIVHPASFEWLAHTQEAVLAAVPVNVTIMRGLADFLDFDGIQRYASHHSRAARYLASISSFRDRGPLDRGAIERLCRSTGVPLTDSDGKMAVAAGHELAFLEVLDRRRYSLDLVAGSPEPFVAESRSSLLH